MKIHFIGIGGIGMSAVAQFFLSEGHSVSGSDLGDSRITGLLEEKGVKVFYEHNAENISDDVGLVIYTSAVDPKNPELKKAKALNIQTISYSESLGLISENKFTIAISGTHGKTTTTAMIAKIMSDAGLSPTVIAGSIMNDFDSNFIKGESKYLIVEACEYKRTFLSLEPNVLVVTNIEEDHLDYYKDLEDIQSAFIELAQKLKKEDFLICDIENPNIQPLIDSKKIECNMIDYHSISSEELKLKILGNYNKENAKAAMAVSAVFGIDKNKIIKSLEEFSGTWRRMENKGETEKGVIIFDDYAHHPTEIESSLTSLFEMFPNKKIVVAFQPHLYSRTKSFLKEFGESFKGVEEVIVAPIYAAREEIDLEISNDILAKEVQKSGVKAKAIDSFEKISDYIKENFDSEYIVVTMGAGDIYKVAEIIVASEGFVDE